MLAPAGLLYWYSTSVVLVVLGVINLVCKTLRWATRRRTSRLGRDTTGKAADRKDFSTPLPTLTTRRQPHHTEKDVKLDLSIPALRDHRIHSRPSRLTRSLETASVAWQKYVLLSEVPMPSWDGRKKRVTLGRMAGTEAFWTCGYAIGVGVLSFVGTRWEVKAWANQAGWVSIAQIPLIIALAGKNNLISVTTGISYEKLNFLHRAAGKVCLIGAWIHTAGYMYLLGGISLLQLQTKLTTWGITSIMSFTLMYVLSIQWFRQKIYEFFLVAHISLAALFLGGVLMHWRAVDVWIYPGIAIWALDRLIRILRLVVLNNLRRIPALSQPASPPRSSTESGSGSATLTLLTPSTLKLSFPAPFPWAAGQHFYVLVPGMSKMPWELHPFTAATVPTLAPGLTGTAVEGGKAELAFIVRVRDGFTRRMKERVDAVRRARGLGVEEECSVRVSGAVEGPYGVGQVLSVHDGVVIFAGGSGISFALAHLLQIIADARAGVSRTKVVKIVWMVKSRLHLNWISPILLAHIHNLPPTLRIDLHVHVTKRYPTTTPESLPIQASLPADPATEPIDWQAYMEARAAEPRRGSGMHRKMSTMSWATFAGDADQVAVDPTDGTVTRRGSEYVMWNGRMRRKTSHPRSIPPDDEEEDAPVVDKHGRVAGEVLRTFTWTDGYQGESLPFGSSSSPRRPGSVDDGPLGRRASAGESSTTLRSAMKRSASVDSNASAFPSPIRTPSYSRTSPADPLGALRTRKVSFADGMGEASASVPLSPSRSRVSIGATSTGSASPLASPSPRRISLPDHGDSGMIMLGRRKSSTGAASLGRRKSSLPLANITEMSPRVDSAAVVDAPLTFDDPEAEEKADVADEQTPALTINFSRPFSSFSEPENNAPAFSENSFAPFTRTGGLRPPPLALDMSRTSSAQSATSITSNTSLLSAGLGSGAITPALSDPGISFEDAEDGRRRQSLGLEGILRWHEGRADPRGAIKSVKEHLRSDFHIDDEETGLGGQKEGSQRVEVLVCGPSSLMRAVRDAARAEMSVGDVWSGGVRVGLQSESFGW